MRSLSKNVKKDPLGYVYPELKKKENKGQDHQIPTLTDQIGYSV